MCQQDPNTIFCLLIPKRSVEKGTPSNPSPLSKTDSFYYRKH